MIERVAVGHGMFFMLRQSRVQIHVGPVEALYVRILQLLKEHGRRTLASIKLQSPT